MLNDIITVLGPMQLVIAGLLFFNVAWVALHKWLAAAVFGLSVGEAPLAQLWLQLHAFVMPPDGAAEQLLCTLLANTLLAIAIWAAVRGLQHWARATLERSEAEFWAMLERDEQLQRATHRH